MKIAILSTSPRPDSNSIKVARYIKAQLNDPSLEKSIFSFVGVDIPMIGRGDIDLVNPSDFVSQLINVWKEAELVIFVVPEYNWMTSGELINALHQLGNDETAYLFDNKAFAFVGVSNGRGGRQPCLEIGRMVNKLISFLNVHSIVSPKLFESHETHKNLEPDGSSKGNPIYENGMDDFLKYTLKIAERWHK